MAEPLLAPAGGVPELISTPEQLAEMIAELKSGTGPIAIDAERASGYKYSQRAYLIQIYLNGEIQGARLNGHEIGLQFGIQIP